MSADFAGVLEKKNAIGLWTKKFATITGLTLNVADAEGGVPVNSIDLQGITRGGDAGDPLLLVFLGTNGDLQLRGTSQAEADAWYNAAYQALVNAGKARARNVGLPPLDPRNNLRFVDIPPEFLARFANLERAVLYWFAPVKKYGVPNRVTRKCSVEDRIGFCGDKAFYVTKPNSEVTRCIKISAIKGLFTNIGVRDPKDEPFIVFKMTPPDFDLYIGHATCDSLLQCLKSLYSYLNRGQELPVVQVKQAQDPAVQLQLARPAAFEMVMVVPTTKEQLKKALDKFAAKHGITFATTAAAEPTSPGGSAQKGSGITSPSMQAANAGGGSPSQQAQRDPNAVPRTDPLGCFLLKLGLERYYLSLYKNQVDLDVLEVMDDTDLKNFGVNDDRAIATIRAKMADLALMEAVKNEVAAARAGWSKGEPSALPAATASSAPPTQTSPSQAQAQSKPPIILDDSDDDLLPPTKSQSNFAIVLDSDDDLELPPPKPKPAAAPITLSDDDI